MYKQIVTRSCVILLGAIAQSWSYTNAQILAQTPNYDHKNTSVKLPIKPDLNQQLKQALCLQDWKKSLGILEQMKKIFPQYSAQIITYRQQIANLAKNNQIIPNWPPDCGK